MEIGKITLFLLCYFATTLVGSAQKIVLSKMNSTRSYSFWMDKEVTLINKDGKKVRGYIVKMINDTLHLRLKDGSNAVIYCYDISRIKFATSARYFLIVPMAFAAFATAGILGVILTEPKEIATAILPLAITGGLTYWLFQLSYKSFNMDDWIFEKEQTLYPITR